MSLDDSYRIRCIMKLKMSLEMLPKYYKHSGVGDKKTKLLSLTLQL